jgi:hypothetical protein
MAHDGVADLKCARHEKRRQASARSATPSTGEAPGGGLLGARLRTALATLLVVGSPGCSLVFTKGPEPEVQPAPQCTTSNMAPIADTVLATGATTVSILGIVLATTPCPPGSWGCYNSVGWIGAAAYGALAILFTASAVTGYTRTKACRASLVVDAVPPPGASVPETSFLALPPTPNCLESADAPRVCALALSSRPAWETGEGAPR